MQATSVRISSVIVRAAAVALLAGLSAQSSLAQSFSNDSPQPVSKVAQSVVLRDSASSPQRMPFTPPVPQLSRKSAVLLGVVVGGAIGATAGYLIGRDNCETCNDSMSAAVPVTLGFIGGAALGAFVGSQNSAPGSSQMSSIPTSRQFLALPHPVVGYHVATFR